MVASLCVVGLSQLACILPLEVATLDRPQIQKHRGRLRVDQIAVWLLQLESRRQVLAHRCHSLQRRQPRGGRCGRCDEQDPDLSFLSNLLEYLLQQVGKIAAAASGTPRMRAPSSESAIRPAVASTATRPDERLSTRAETAA